MKIKILHPLWTHIPATAALVAMIVYLVQAGPLPDQAPVHFDFNGQPNAYGSPWSAFGLVIGLSVFFILLSAFLDELWARQEKSKTFNWLSLLDDIVVGAMVGTNLGYLSFLREGGSSFDFPWSYLALVGGCTIAVAVILEIVRPFRFYQRKLAFQEDLTPQKEIVRQLKENLPLLYWDYQNPFYMSVLTVALPLIMVVAAVFSWFSQPWVAFLLIIVAVLLVIPYGGLRVLVTRQNITVRFGILGIRVFDMKMAEIAGVEVKEFSPLKDFGGYGIRFNREMKAYYLRGTRGVKLTGAGGKKYLIGSDNPERLALIISSIASAK